MIRTICFLLTTLLVQHLSAQEAFITTWKTSTSGDSITISINPDAAGQTIKYDIIWGDGSEKFESRGRYHTSIKLHPSVG